MKTSKLNFKYFLIAQIFAVTLASCHKDKITTPPSKPTAERAGLYVLDQGNSTKPNSALTFYNYTTKQLTADIFTTVNGQGLGNTANDIKIYGSKMYITVDKSGVVYVLDPKTAKIIKQIPFKTGDNSREPRSIAFYKNNAFISLYDGNVAVMDTATYAVSKYIPVGNNPEQLSVANGKLYVANSGGLNYPNVDNTVSVINLTTFTVIKTITVGDDPYAVTVDGYGDVFVNAYGVFGATNASLTIIDSNTDAVKTKVDFGGGPFAINGDNAYYIDSDGIVKVYNVKTAATSNSGFVTDGTTFTAAYAVAADPLTGEVFVTDAKDYNSNGLIFAFDKTGKKEYSLTVGINPGSVVFVNK